MINEDGRMMLVLHLGPMPRVSDVELGWIEVLRGDLDVPLLIADEPYYNDGVHRFGTNEAPGERLKRLIGSIPMVEAVEISEEGPYGRPLPRASERLKRKAQWKKETAWSRLK